MQSHYKDKQSFTLKLNEKCNFLGCKSNGGCLHFLGPPPPTCPFRTACVHNRDMSWLVPSLRICCFRPCTPCDTYCSFSVFSPVSSSYPLSPFLALCISLLLLHLLRPPPIYTSLTLLLLLLHALALLLLLTPPLPLTSSLLTHLSY